MRKDFTCMKRYQIGNYLILLNTSLPSSSQEVFQDRAQTMVSRKCMNWLWFITWLITNNLSVWSTNGWHICKSNLCPIWYTLHTSHVCTSADHFEFLVHTPSCVTPSALKPPKNTQKKTYCFDSCDSIKWKSTCRDFTTQQEAAAGKWWVVIILQ